MSSCTLWVPIDVVKERMQIQRAPYAGAEAATMGAPVFYKNSWHAITTILRTQGVRSLYKVCVVTGLPGYVSVQLVQCKENWSVCTLSVSASVFSMLRQRVNTQGYGATLASFGPFSALYFLFYEKVRPSSCAWRSTEPAHDTRSRARAAKDHGTTGSKRPRGGQLADVLVPAEVRRRAAALLLRRRSSLYVASRAALCDRVQRRHCWLSRIILHKPAGPCEAAAAGALWSWLSMLPRHVCRCVSLFVPVLAQVQRGAEAAGTASSETAFGYRNIVHGVREIARYAAASQHTSMCVPVPSQTA